MKNNVYLFVIFCFLMSCSNKEDSLKAELSNFKYALIDGPEGSVTHYMYELQKNCGVTIWTYPTIGDYRYSFDEINDVRLVPCKQEKLVIEKGVNLLREVFVDHYPDDFKQRFFPVLLFPVDSIITHDIYGDEVNANVYIGRNFLAMANVNENKTFSKEELLSLQIELNICFWLTYVRMVYPEWELNDFAIDYEKTWYLYDLPEDYTLADIDEGKRVLSEKLYAKGILGFTFCVMDGDLFVFLDRIYENDINVGDIEPLEHDLKAYLSMLFTKTPEELDAFLNLEGLEKVKNRLEILSHSILDFFGFDIRKFNAN